MELGKRVSNAAFAHRIALRCAYLNQLLGTRRYTASFGYLPSAAKSLRHSLYFGLRPNAFGVHRLSVWEGRAALSDLRDCMSRSIFQRSSVPVTLSRLPFPTPSKAIDNVLRHSTPHRRSTPVPVTCESPQRETNSRGAWAFVRLRATFDAMRRAWAVIGTTDWGTTTDIQPGQLPGRKHPIYAGQRHIRPGSFGRVRYKTAKCVGNSQLSRPS